VRAYEGGIPSSPVLRPSRCATSLCSRDRRQPALIPEGELRIEQEGKTFTAKKNFVWTCNKDTKEQAYKRGERGRDHADHGPQGLRLVSS
jgi:hypothetical protein